MNGIELTRRIRKDMGDDSADFIVFDSLGLFMKFEDESQRGRRSAHFAVYNRYLSE